MVIANGPLVPVTEPGVLKTKLAEVAIRRFRQLPECGFVRFCLMTGHFAAGLTETIPF
jgi:hypothetical protein